MSQSSRCLTGLFLSIALVALAGCGGHHGDATHDTAAHASDAPVEITISADNLEAVRTVLAAADRLDGAEDGVVHKCPGCALAMDGSADHTMTVADHELHFCSDTCRGRFTENAEDSLVALDVPGL